MKARLALLILALLTVGGLEYLLWYALPRWLWSRAIRPCRTCTRSCALRNRARPQVVVCPAEKKE